MVSQSSYASLISFDTKSLSGEQLTGDLQSSWLANSNKVRSRELEKFELIDIGRNTIGHLSIDFNLAKQGFWSFDFGLDAGYGAELFIDGNLLVDRSDNLWWTRNWQHSDVFSIDTYDFSIGAHTIDVFFAENCCDGLSTVRFTNHATQETSILSTDSLKSASVSEPKTVAIFALGALGFMLRRKF